MNEWWEVEVRLYGRDVWWRTNTFVTGVDDGWKYENGALEFIDQMRACGDTMYADASWRTVLCKRNVYTTIEGRQYAR